RRAALVKDRARGRIDLMAAVLAPVGRAILDPVELARLLALRARRSGRIEAVAEVVQAGLVGRERLHELRVGHLRVARPRPLRRVPFPRAHAPNCTPHTYVSSRDTSPFR